MGALHRAEATDERRKKESRNEHAQMEELVAAAEFEKTKRVRDVRQAQELEVAKLEADHQKNVLQQNRQAAESILESLDMISVDNAQWDRMQQELQAARGEVAAGSP